MCGFGLITHIRKVVAVLVFLGVVRVKECEIELWSKDYPYGCTYIMEAERGLSVTNDITYTGRSVNWVLRCFSKKNWNNTV